MNITTKKITEDEKERGFNADDKAVIDVSSVELNGLSYVEIRVDGVTLCTVKAGAR